MDESVTKMINNQQDIKLGQFTLKELKVVLTKVKNRKAASIDEIPTEIWKTKEFDNLLLQYSNAVYNQNTIERWTKGCILLFPKKDDQVITKNYWCITLTSIATKLLNRIKLKLIKFLERIKMVFREIDPQQQRSDLVFLANTPTQAEYRLHSLEQAAGGIGLHVNADKTECMCFNQKGEFSALNGGSLKLVDKFKYLGSSVSSTERDINMRLAKARITIDHMEV